jgi:hypothetical protein
MTNETATGLDVDMRQAAGDSLAAHRICLETLNYCMQSGGNHAAPKLLRLLTDCAEICSATANFILRDSEAIGHLCEVCAEIAADCARACLEFGDDATMKACADACLQVGSSAKKLCAPPDADYDKTVADSFPASDPPAMPSRT